MSSRLLRAVVVGFMLSTAPLASAPVWAATPPATADSLQSVIAGAAKAAASDPAFLGLSPEAKLAAIQGAVSAALAKSGASPEVIADALIQAVGAKVISGGVALAVAATVAPDFATKVSQSAVVQAQLQGTGQTGSATGATSTGGVSILVNLQGAQNAGAGAGSTAAYDPCAGVIAAYCGS